MGKYFLGLLLLSSTLFTACSRGPRLEACNFIEVEEPEAEVEVGDVDIEGGEVEMLCDEVLVDVPWPEFKKNFQINPKEYLNDIEGLKSLVSCVIDASSDTKVVSCHTTDKPNEYKSLKYNLDD